MTGQSVKTHSPGTTPAGSAPGDETSRRPGLQNAPAVSRLLEELCYAVEGSEFIWTVI